MNKDKINSSEFASLIPFLSTSAIMGSGFLYLYENSEKSALISMLIGLIISIILNLIVFKTFNVLPNETLSNKIKKLFPKWLYYIINIILFLLFLILSSLVLFRLTTFFNTQFLTDSSKIILSLVLIIIPLYFSFKNIETITRFTSVTLSITIFVFLFNAFSILPQIEIKNILPLIDASYTKIITSSLVFSVLFSGPSLSLLILPKNNISDKKNLKKHLIINYLIVGIMILGINFFTLGSMGIEITKIYTYPVYTVLKKIHTFEFINSIENITILLWFFFLIVTTSLYLLFAKNIFMEVFKFKKKSEKFLVPLFSIFLIIFPLIIFKDKATLDTPNLAFYPIVLFSIIYVIYILIIVLAKMQKK